MIPINTNRLIIPYHKVLKLLNFLIPKHRYIYISPHENCAVDMYDVINSNSDNALCLLKYIVENRKLKDYKIYVEYYHEDRLSEYIKWTKKFDANNINFINANIYDKSWIRKFILKTKNLVIRFGCRTWITDTPYNFYYEKNKSQICICLGYCTPFKRVKTINDVLDFRFIDFFIQTSLLTASIYSSDFQIPLKRFELLGFPRNDTILNSNKRENVIKWINDNTTAEYSKLLLYVPTYRDYENAYDGKNIMGYKDNAGVLDKFLEDNNLLLVYKMHPKQKSISALNSNRIICYKKSFDFSLYDLLSVSDILISDYSSVIHDYLISGKPVILNFFDRSLYDEVRGFAFKPIDFICPGEIVESLDALCGAIRRAINLETVDLKYDLVRKLFHENTDGTSTERVFSFVCSHLK